MRQHVLFVSCNKHVTGISMDCPYFPPCAYNIILALGESLLLAYFSIGSPDSDHARHPPR